MNALDFQLSEVERRLRGAEDAVDRVETILRLAMQALDGIRPPTPVDTTPPPPPPNFNCAGTLILVDDTLVARARVSYGNSSGGTSTTAYQPMHLIGSGGVYTAWTTGSITLSDFAGGSKNVVLSFRCGGAGVTLTAFFGASVEWDAAMPANWPDGPYDVHFTHFLTPASGFVSGEVALP